MRGFGTFRRVWMAPRKSVNVQTGEDILLDGYYRVVFVPDRELKERVNEPYAHLEPVVLDGEPEAAQPASEPDPLATLAEQADEIKGLLSEIRAMSAAAVPAGEVAARPEPAAPAADEPPAPEEKTSPAEASPDGIREEETPASEEKASPAATSQEEPSQPQETPPAPAETAPKGTPCRPAAEAAHRVARGAGRAGGRGGADSRLLRHHAGAALGEQGVLGIRHTDL